MDEERYGGWSRERFTGQDIAELEALLTENPTERHNLEYKGPGWSSPKNQKSSWKHELAWQVASLANSAGGLLVWGVDEHRDDPGSGPTVEPTEERFDGQRLSDILNTGVEPALDYRDFEVITYPVEGGRFVHVIYVPQSARAPHMVVSEARNGEHHGRYPKRSCEGPQVMLDYEVRDVMGRRQRPSLRLNIVQQPKPDSIGGVVSATLYLTLENSGRTAARDVTVVLTQQAVRGVTISTAGTLWQGRRCAQGMVCVLQRIEERVLPGLSEDFFVRWDFNKVPGIGEQGFRFHVETTVYADGIEPVKQYYRWFLPLGYSTDPESCTFRELLADDAKDAAKHFGSID